MIPVPALLHNHPERIGDAVAELSAGHDVVAVAYGDCGTLRRARRVARASRASTATTCSRATEVRAALDEEPGTYFLTDFLARTFEHTVWRELGLDRYPELRDEYFGNYTRVMWLAQRPTPATRAAAERAAARLGLPLVVREVGNKGLEVRARAAGRGSAGHPVDRTAHARNALSTATPASIVHTPIVRFRLSRSPNTK